VVTKFDSSRIHSKLFPTNSHTMLAAIWLEVLRSVKHARTAKIAFKPWRVPEITKKLRYLPGDTWEAEKYHFHTHTNILFRKSAAGPSFELRSSNMSVCGTKF